MDAKPVSPVQCDTSGFRGNVTAHGESSQVNQIMFTKESVHDFWLNWSDWNQREVGNSGVWNNSQRKYCCQDDAACEVEI